MNDVERLVRDTLRRHEAEVPLLDLSDPRPVARRARRRQALNAVATGIVAVVVAVGATAGIGALLRAGEHTPAEILEPPADAPLVVSSGITQGWGWLLSVSENGACVALTDAQGSDVNCNIGRPDLIIASVRSPRPPAPPVLFIFGRVPPGTVDVVGGWTGGKTQGEVFDPPRDLDVDSRFVDSRYFVEWVSPMPHPIVPRATVWALDDNGAKLGFGPFSTEGAQLQRPSWARAPLVALQTIASGQTAVLKTPWEIAIFRNRATGELCFGEVWRHAPSSPEVANAATAACGPDDDPVPAWRSKLSRLEVIEEGTSMLGHIHSTLVWGVISDPIVSVRVEILKSFGPQGDGGEAHMFDLPAEYGGSLRVFVFTCNCRTGDVLGIDGDGNVTERR